MDAFFAFFPPQTDIVGAERGGLIRNGATRGEKIFTYQLCFCEYWGYG